MPQVVIVSSLGPQGQVGPQGPSGSFDNISGSFLYTSSFNEFTASYKIDSASFNNGIASNSSSIAALSSSYLLSSASFNTRILSNSSSIALLSGSYSTGSFTGSFTGSATLGSLTASSAFVTGNVTVLGTASINTLVVNQTQLSTGSNQLGDAVDDTQTLYGTVVIPTGSFAVSGNASITGSISIGTTAQSTVALSAGYGSSSNLTVGTTSIYTTYQIANGNTDHVFYTRGTSGTTVERLRIKGSAAITDLQVTSSNFVVQNNALYVSASGLVGIRTTTPTQALDVSGSIALNGNIIQNQANLDIKLSGTLDGRALRFISSANGARIQAVGSTASNLSLGTTVGGSEVTRLTILEGGNVGIGTTTPTAKLQVVGSGTTSATTALLVQNANASSSLAVLDNGNVGIGTSTPTAKLEIKATGSSETTQRWLDDEGKLLGDFAEVGDAGILRIGYVISSISTNRPLITLDGGAGNSSAGIYLRSKSATNNIRIASDIPSYISGSSLALGFINPAASAILHISGAAADNLFRVDTPAVPYTLFVTGSGNVGIGTSTPTERLEVNGSILIEGSSDYRLKLGAPIGQQFSLGTVWNGSYDTMFIDYSALGSPRIMTFQGNGNVGIGTTTPSAKLHVSGTIKIESTAAEKHLEFTRVGNNYISTANGGALLINVVGTAAENTSLFRVYPSAVMVGSGIPLTTATFNVRGSGTTSGTTALLVQNANASASLVVLDNGATTLSSLENTTPLTISGYLATGSSSQPALDITGSWNTSGAPTLIRATVADTNSQNTSKLIDLRVGSTSYFNIDRIGRSYIGFQLIIGGSVTINNLQTALTTDVVTATNNHIPTSGTTSFINSQTSFLPSSGTAQFISFYSRPIINQTGGANGITRGLYINPTLTSAADWRAIEINSGSIILADNYVASGSRSGSILDISQTWNVSGSGVVTGIKYNVTNISSSTSSNLLDLQVGGASMFKITAGPAPGPVARNGYVFGGNGVSAISPIDPTTTFFSSTGTAIRISDANSGAGYSYHIYSAQYTDKTYTSGVGGFVSVTRGFAPTSGTGVFNVMVLENTINQTGGANGITRGLFISPTLTAAADFRAIQNTVGNNLLNSTSGNTYVGLSTNTGTARLQVRGSGTTSATTALLVQNVNASASLTITDDLNSRFYGNVGIGAAAASGSFHISASASTSSAAVYIYKSGSTTLDIQGSQGQLFSVTDQLSGSLMSVNDISGLPILEVFSDDRVTMGSFANPALIITGSAVRFPATGSAAPTYSGSNGETIFTVIGGNAFMYVWLGGRWRSGSLA